MLYLGRDLSELVEKEAFIRKLPLRKRRFIETYLSTLSLHKTAKLMRMSYNRASRMMMEDDIQKGISYYQDLVSFRNTITQDYFVRNLREIIEAEDSKKSEKINALALLARITGHLKDREEKSADNIVLVKVDNNVVSDALEDDDSPTEVEIN